MRIAVCSPDMGERYTLSRQLEKSLLQRGVLPEISLFPMLPELVEATAHQMNSFSLIIISDIRDAVTLKDLCRRVPVILVGKISDGPDAFDIGAEYFIKSPVEPSELEKALTRCIAEQ